MNLGNRFYIQAREKMLGFGRAHTLTEYALIRRTRICAALGNNIGSLASGVDSGLTNA